MQTKGQTIRGFQRLQIQRGLDNDRQSHLEKVSLFHVRQVVAQKRFEANKGVRFCAAIFVVRFQTDAENAGTEQKKKKGCWWVLAQVPVTYSTYVGIPL